MPNDIHAKLKHLQTIRKTVTMEIKENIEKIKDSNRRINMLQNKLKEIDQQIATLTENGQKIIIKEHAYLRYFERVLGYDLAEIAKKIIPEKVEEQINVLTSGTFPIGDGAKIVVKKKSVITVIGKNGEK